MTTRSAQAPSFFDVDFVDKIIAAQADRPGSLLGILAKVQDHHPKKYLPRDVLQYIAEKTNIPLSRIFSVVTFYALFSLEPQGDNTISICRGTACHTRGSRDLLETLMISLALKNAEDGQNDKLSMTTPDGQTTLRTVACFGQCALAPVIEVNHSIFGHMNEQALQRELDALKKRETRK